MILTWLSPLRDQGGYAIAVNYGLSPLSPSLHCPPPPYTVHPGSLVARIVFQPVEEMCRLFFSKTLGTPVSDSAMIGPKSNAGQVRRIDLQRASSALFSLLAVQVSLSIVLVIFGTAYMPIVQMLILPSRFLSTSAPKILSAWIWYIPVLAINGGVEAFFASVATSSDLIDQSRYDTSSTQLHP